MAGRRRWGAGRDSPPRHSRGDSTCLSNRRPAWGPATEVGGAQHSQKDVAPGPQASPAAVQGCDQRGGWPFAIASFDRRKSLALESTVCFTREVSPPSQRVEQLAANFGPRTSSASGGRPDSVTLLEQRLLPPGKHRPRGHKGNEEVPFHPKHTRSNSTPPFVSPFLYQALKTGQNSFTLTNWKTQWCPLSHFTSNRQFCPHS